MTRVVNNEEQAHNMSESLDSGAGDPKPGCRDMTQEDALSPWDFFNFPTTSTSVPELLVPLVPSESVEQLDVDTLMIKAFSNTVTLENVSETTSLCSWAFSLVLRNNAKGYSATDLDLKLRAGYRFGALPTEGCRVDNRTLLKVLAEVS
jgi:hypothetical protein